MKVFRSSRTPPRALIFGSFAPTVVASGLDVALANLLSSPLRDRYDLVVYRMFRGENSSRGIVQRLGFGLWLFLQSIWRLVSSRCSVVDVHAVSGRDLLKNGAVVLAARAIRRPIVLRIHGGNFERAYREAGVIEKSIVRALLRLANRVVLLSTGWEEIVKSIEPAVRTAVIPNSVDCEALAAAQRQRPFTAQDVLMLGNFCERKGHFDAVSAAVLVKKSHPHVHFYFFGTERDPGALAALETEVRAQGLEDTVHFMPPVFDTDKQNQIAKAGIFILPSHTENMPMAIVEAMAAGMAVIATTVGAIPEMIEDGVSGILIEPRQPARLAEAIIRLVDDPLERARMGGQAAETARQTWDKKIVGNRTAEFFDSVTGRTNN